MMTEWSHVSSVIIINLGNEKGSIADIRYRNVNMAANLRPRYRLNNSIFWYNTHNLATIQHYDTHKHYHRLTINHTQRNLHYCEVLEVIKMAAVVMVVVVVVHQIYRLIVHSSL